MKNLKELFEKIAAGKISPTDALKVLGHADYVDLGHTKVDLQRFSRRRVPEVVFGSYKTAKQTLEIAECIEANGQPLLCTHVSAEKAAFILEKRPDFQYDSTAQVIYKKKADTVPAGLVAVLSAGTSDLPVAEEAAVCLEVLGSRVERVHDVGVAGLHRLFESASKVLAKANVIVVVAGMEGALPSVIAGLVDVPVVAVPTSVGYGASFGGVSALLGMLNACSGGIGVVNIDNGFGAALLAHLINCPKQKD